MKRRVSEETWQSEILCRRPLTRGRVFPAFDRMIHVREDCPAAGRTAPPQISLGIDFGYASPFVCLWVMKLGEVSWVIDEYVQRERTLDHHLGQIEQRTQWGT